MAADRAVEKEQKSSACVCVHPDEAISKECIIPDKLSCTATTKIGLSEHLFQLCTDGSADRVAAP